ncbi:YkvI family membrane protein [Oribacterium sp. WCC10]|uniref:YkvI family membrane protein n=1 Tax=Oribacterium sp. WCC10 TaxID=1855343 RepID=UPI0008E118CA|nr:hypothetical protein [Oribacterium sp. WCC10]SFG54145.1 Uncharacterized membrane protein YkvI [Oribacterium sp. WCC10]
MKYEYWRIAFAFIGVIVGAGLSSGQDLLQYFLCFGTIGLLGVVLLGVLNVIFGKIMVTLGCYYRADNHEEVFSQITNPLFTRILDIVLVVGSFVMGFVMVAGAGSNLNQQFGIPSSVGALLCSFLIVAVSFMDFDKITNVLGIFTPVIIVMILFITAYTFIGKSYDFRYLDISAKTIKPAMNNVFLSVINYYALCAMTGVSMAFILGGAIVRIGVAEKGGTYGGVMVGVIVLAASLSIFANIDKVKDADMPMLAIVNNIHPVFALMYAFTVFALIFNTAFSLYYSIARRFSNGDTKKMRVLMIAVATVGYVCSFGGFKTLIGVMYPVLGYMGVVLLVILFVAWTQKRRDIIMEKFFRRKMLRISLKKHYPETDITKKEKELFHNLGEISPADTETLKQDIHETAKKIIEDTDDVEKYLDEHLLVDDDKLHKNVSEMMDNQ